MVEEIFVHPIHFRSHGFGPFSEGSKTTGTPKSWGRVSDDSKSKSGSKESKSWAKAWEASSDRKNTYFDRSQTFVCIINICNESSMSGKRLILHTFLVVFLDKVA